MPTPHNDLVISETAAGPRTTDQLFAAVRDSNPFSSNRVSEPSPHDVDVPTIHQREFRKLVQLAGQANQQRRGIGVTLLGGAGVGKSHLLSRLWRWANQDRQAVYVFLHNVLASPERLPRYLLRSVISMLVEGRSRAYNKTQLYDILHATMKASLQSSGRSAPVSRQQCQTAFHRQISALANDRRDREIYEVLFQFFCCVNMGKPRELADAVVDWLSGDAIEPELAEQIGLPSGNGAVSLQDDQDVEKVLIALTELAALAGHPFVLCIDQVDNLDPDKINAVYGFLHALVDHAPNLLMIISGVKHTLLDYHESGLIPQAAWDRLAEHQIQLRRISPDAGEEIIEARLKTFFESFQDLPELRPLLQREGLFPLGYQWWEQQKGDALELRPRDVISWARDAWEQEQFRLQELGGQAWLNHWPRVAADNSTTIPPSDNVTLDELVDRKVAAKIKECIAQRQLHPGSLPPDADNLLTLAESLLMKCLNRDDCYTLTQVERARVRNSKNMPCDDLIVQERRNGDGQPIRNRVVFLATNDGRSICHALKGLLGPDHSPDHRLLVTDEQRQPLRLTPAAGQYYDQLQRMGDHRFQHIKLDFQQYAELDALEAVVGLARVGDLEVEFPQGTIRPVSEAEVIASLHRQQRFTAQRLLHEFLTEEPAVIDECPEKVPLDREDVRQVIHGNLAWRLGLTTYEATKIYLQQRAALEVDFEAAKEQITEIAREMHEQGLLHATPQDDDLFLQYLKHDSA